MHNKLTDAQAYYNYRPSCASLVVEQTFGCHLACCILHICIVQLISTIQSVHRK